MPRAGLLAGALMVAVVVAVACGPRPTPEWNQEDGYRWRELGPPPAGGWARLLGGRAGSPGFDVVSPRRSGIDFSNDLSERAALANRHLTHGSGVTLGDFDGDELPDVFLARLEGPNALYRNLGGWRFEDVTERAGVGAADRYSTGAAGADVDGDGDLDLIVTALGGPNAVFVNDGTGRFSERPLEPAVDSTGSTTVALADVDGDGDLDLYVANYKLRSAIDALPPEERRFEDIVEQVDGVVRVAPRFAEDFRVFERPDLGAVGYVQRAEPDAFYLNDGDGRFERVRFTDARFRDEDGAPFAEEPDYFALAGRFHDVNDDGAPDLFVANDFEDPDLFWLNDGSGGFRLAPRLTLRATSNAGMAVDFSDVDRDGDVDFLEVDMLALDRELRMTQVPTHTPLPHAIGAIEDRPQRMHNALFLNRGDATFAQVADLSGLEASGWSWATLFLDVDLDGFEDVLVTTGHSWDIMDEDTQRRLGTLEHDWREEFRLFPDLDRPNRAFRNRGDVTFEEVGSAWGLGDGEDVAHGIATADLDLDGDLDVVITRLNAPPLLLRNRGGAPRVAVRLVGRAPNTRAVGAVATLRGGGLPAQRKEVTAGGLYLSGADATLAFAAAADAEHTLEIRWRDGSRSRIDGVRAGRLYDVWEARVERVAPVAPGAAGEAAGAGSSAADGPYFEDVTASLGHVHVETPYDDWARQPLLTHQLSRSGPGVTWYDVDRDGWEDLVVPSGRGGRAGYFRNDAGTLRPADGGPVAEADQTMALPLPDGRGGTRVIIGQSSYEAESPERALALPAAFQMGTPRRELIPGDTTSAGPMAAADVDGDGDLDLFVGGRVVPGAYPLAVRSRLFENRPDGFVLDGANAPALRGLGMVSGATFSDVDGDGDPDLLLAVEWGAPALLLNENGRLRRAGPEWGLDGDRGRWIGVATGDFDADGRPDLVVTGWGRNVRFGPEPGRPLVLHFGDLDRSGSLDLVWAQRLRPSGPLLPLHRFDRLAAGVPVLNQRVESASAYARASVMDLFGPALDAGGRYEADSYAHRVYFNRGGRFEAVELPLEAQVAPVHAANVGDFDGDGHEDLFLSQNFFPVDPASSRLDGGRGVWLRGDGTGALVPVPGQSSGVQVWGDARGAGLADFDGDARVDLAVAQNGAATLLFRNVAAEPGVRVRLLGGPGNPHGVGASMRLVYADRVGPAREVKLGSGYWSVDGVVQVLGGARGATAVRVRWPGGEETEHPLEPGAAEVTVRTPGL